MNRPSASELLFPLILRYLQGFSCSCASRCQGRERGCEAGVQSEGGPTFSAVSDGSVSPHPVTNQTDMIQVRSIEMSIFTFKVNILSRLMYRLCRNCSYRPEAIYEHCLCSIRYLKSTVLIEPCFFFVRNQYNT